MTVQSAPTVWNATYTFSNVVTGPYIVKVTDPNGDSAQDTIVVDQIQNPMTVSTNYQNIKCLSNK